jgi:putative FmdB family regulatory protein
MGGEGRWSGAATLGPTIPHLYSPPAMPIYEYRCENGHLFEVLQKMTDEPVTSCEECGAPVQRVFHPIAVHFKGSGFYNTDYGTAKRKREMSQSAKDGADKHDAKQSEKKSSDTAASSSSSSSSSSTSSSSSSGDSSGSSSSST